MPLDLLTSPRWRPEDLGLPMPDSVHAVSACLPLWEHNLRYEEGDPEVVERLQAAYPRFRLHPLVREVCRMVFGAEDRGLVFAGLSSAQRALAWVQQRSGVIGSLVPIDGQPFWGVGVVPAAYSALREYWQHAGEIISSRSAEQVLQGHAVTRTETPARVAVRRRLQELRQNPRAISWLHPCGMSAIAAALRIIRKRDPVNPTVQFGFPYVDSLKLQQKLTPGTCQFLPLGRSDDLERLSEILTRMSVSAVFCEAPTNPLLVMPDVHRLKQLSDQYGFIFVIDDTLTACVNQDLLPLADMIVTSLTKYFSGYGDVLAGALTLNPDGRHAEALRLLAESDFEELLSDIDVDVLERNSRDVTHRVSVINQNAAIIADRFRVHSAVQQVFYPEAVDSGHPGRGGLMSIVLRNPERNTPRVFDRLQVCKGPNLGTNFTLCCPYTILAHFEELDTVESMGVSRWLLRISIGTEPVEELWKRFEDALSVAD